MFFNWWCEFPVSISQFLPGTLQCPRWPEALSLPPTPKRHGANPPFEHTTSPFRTSFIEHIFKIRANISSGACSYCWVNQPAQTGKVLFLVIVQQQHGPLPTPSGVYLKVFLLEGGSDDFSNTGPDSSWHHQWSRLLLMNSFGLKRHIFSRTSALK